MKIAKLIENNLVISADQTVKVTEVGIFGQGWENSHLTGKVVIEEVEALPNGYEDSAWSHANGVWAVVSQSAVDANVKAKEATIRYERNYRLTECDWTQIADAPVDKEAWATYRQALRDIPAQEGFPWEVTFPEMPK